MPHSGSRHQVIGAGLGRSMRALAAEHGCGSVALRTPLAASAATPAPRGSCRRSLKNINSSPCHVTAAQDGGGDGVAMQEVLSC